MSRRALTFFLGLLLAVGLAFVAGAQRVPYVLLSPGPAFNTLGAVGSKQVLTISGRPTYPTEGALDATTVSVTSDVTLFTALKGWLDGGLAVVPREFVFPPDQSQQQNDQQSARDMRQSQNDAATAALRALGIPGTQVVSVASVDTKGPSHGRLQPGDVLTSIDGVRVTDVASLHALISRHHVGDSVVVGYTRAKTAHTLTVVTGSASDDPTRAVIGIGPSVEWTFPVTVDISLQDVGGPSAGLMFALGIVDKLQPGSLTGGLRVAGTGEITTDGNVGIIGGIAQKMRGAVADGATVFLVPAGNCEEARAARPHGLRLLKVSTLKGALSSLAALRQGDAPPTC